MTTRDTIEAYLESLHRQNGWQAFFADDVTFASFAAPPRRVTGHMNVAESTARFYGMIVSFETRDLLIDGDRACVTNRYQLRPPLGDPFASDVAEVFTIRDGRITALAIYFDSAPYPQR